MTTKNKILLSSLLAGGVTFWLAESFFSLFGEMLTAKSWITIQTIFLPLILIVLLLVIVKKFKPEGAILNAFSMVFGIWLLSPFYILVLRYIFRPRHYGIKGSGVAVTSFSSHGDNNINVQRRFFRSDSNINRIARSRNNHYK